MKRERDDIYYEAMRARDHRFDGKFFVGVKTTGVYCRPICPAKPKRQNVEFFASSLEAEKAGYRPCLRCRPEAAPLSPAWIGKSAVVKRAVKILHRHDEMLADENQFAERFGVSARHLRRLFVEELGKTPKQLSAEARLNTARKLIVETNLPIAQLALGASFRSVRRFNAAFRARFKKSPSQIRRSPLATGNRLTLSLAYRPPFDYEGLLHFYRAHQTGQLEWLVGDSLHRIFSLDGKVGQVAVRNDPARARLLVEVELEDPALVHTVLARVRSWFDLDSDPLVIANSLELDPGVKAILRKHPGIRLPSGWDPFEVAIATILGQLVSVERGRALVADLIEMLGEESGITREGRAVKLFPTPLAIANADLTGLKTTGMRKQTLRAFASAVDRGELSLESTQDVASFLDKLMKIKGVGPWTASYMALKVLRDTDAFPATDLILARALELHPAECLEQMRPWRGYAAVLFWREYAHTLTKRSKK